MQSNESVKDQDQIDGGIDIIDDDSEEPTSNSEEDNEENIELLSDEYSHMSFCQLLAGNEALRTQWSENLKMAYDYFRKKLLAEKTGQKFEETLDPCLMCLFCKEGQQCSRFLLLGSFEECLEDAKSLAKNLNNPPTNE